MSSSNTFFVANRFRVIARTRNGKQFLVSFCTAAEAARNIIEQYSQGLVERKEQVHSLWVEEWIGMPTHGQWIRMRGDDDGLFRKLGGTELALTNSGFKSGDVVDAVLLEKRTRRGGWNAALESNPLVRGPVTLVTVSYTHLTLPTILLV